MYRVWKKGQATWEQYRSIIRVCKDAKRKAKVYLELNLARAVQDIKKGFKSIISKRKSRENCGGCREGGVTEHLLCFSFIAKASTKEPQTLEARGKV